MRLLIIAETAPPFAEELRRIGHQVRLVPPKARSVAGALLERHDLAHLALSVPLSIVALLTAARIPYLVAVPGDAVEQSPLRNAALIRGARAVIAPSEAAARFAVDTLGAREASIVPPGLELDRMPLGDRAAAKRALDLQPTLRLIALVERLEGLRLDLLAEVHRKLSGVGLLVVGDGPQADFVQAMRAATRPSSPVIFFGERSFEDQLHAIRAAQLVLSGAAADPRALALGRRQIASARSDLDGIYPAELNAVQVVEERSPPALRRALEAGLEAEERGPLPAQDVERARAALGWGRTASLLAEVMADAAAGG